MGTYRVIVKKQGIVEVIVKGDHDGDSVRTMGEKAAKALKDLSARGKPALLLDNVVDVGYITPDARQLVVTLSKDMSFDKLAMYCKGPALKLAANLILHAVGRAGKVRYFDDYREAIEWLTAQ